MITNIKGELVPFILNPVQLSFLKELGIDPNSPFPLKDKRIRAMVLKSRRQGLSTLLQALLFIDTYNNNNRRSLAIAHDRESTQVIFEMVTRFYDNLPEHMKIKADRNNVGEIYWGEIDSRFYVETANKRNAGSGATLHNVLKDERAKWDLEEHLIRSLDASLDEACSHGNIFEVSTAWGMNHFKIDWDESVKRNLEGNYRTIAVFIPWFRDPTYRTQVRPDFVKTDEERRRQDIYGVDDEQLQWRRDKEEGRGKLVDQEYPYCPLDAFMTSGHPVFNREKLQVMDAEINRVEVINGQNVRVHAPQKGLVIPAEFARLRDAYKAGEFRIYRTPEFDMLGKSKEYLVTADTAEGLNPARGDFDVAHVYDVDTWEQVAVIEGRWDATYWGKMIAELGWFYFEALCAPEDNNHGHQAIAGIVELGYPDQRGNGYHGLYYFRNEHINSTLKVSAMEGLKPGWPTFRRTKLYCIDKMADSIENDSAEDGFKFNDPVTVSQLTTFVNLGNGKMGGEAGQHDDHVTCACIAAALLRIRFRRTRREVSIQPREPTAGYGNLRSY